MPENLEDHFERLAVSVWQALTGATSTNGSFGDLLRSRAGHSLALTSCHAGEGVTTVAANLAAALAERPDRRVLLVDANLRDPQLHQRFDRPEKPGIAEVLKGEVALEAAVQRLDQPGLHLLAGGQPQSAPIALLDAQRFDGVIGAAGYDCVVLDCPPLLDAPETELLLRRTDGFVLVVEAHQTRWEVVQRAMLIAKRADARLLGSVLNRQKRHIPERLYRLL